MEEFLGWSSNSNGYNDNYPPTVDRIIEGVSLPNYIEEAVEIGKILNHTVIAVLTGNITYLVDDIVTYASAAKHCKAECKRLCEQFKIVSDSAKDLLKKLEENPKEIEDKSFAFALKAFAMVLEDGRAIIKQHAEAKYGLKIFHAKKFAAEFQKIEDRLDKACQNLKFAITIRHYVDGQEIEEERKTWHEEDKIAFEEITNLVKDSLKEIRGFNKSKNTSSQELLGTKILATELTNMQQYKTYRLFSATYRTVDENRNSKDIKVLIKVTMAREAVQEEKSKFALEVAYLQKLAPCPNIIDLIGITSLRGNLSLVLKYCEHGDLQTFIAKNSLKGDWGKKRSIALDISQGIAFLHKAGILHKYINSANILLDKHFQAKITNFRKSRWVDMRSMTVIDSFEEQIRWTAPERLEDEIAPKQRFTTNEIINHLEAIKPEELEDSNQFYNVTCEDSDGPDLSVDDVVLEGYDNELLKVTKTVRELALSDTSEDENVPSPQEILNKAENYHYMRNYIKARQEFNKIEDYFPQALFRMGEYYFFGKGVNEDIGKAIQYFERAIEKGDGDAMDMMGYMHLKGNKVLPKDRIKAVKLFIQAVEKGIPHGMYHLGVCYFKGIGGLKKDEETSKKLILKAASLGNAEAQKYAHLHKWDLISGM
ncbi:7557_t:CDS:2 [Diversispora eburnea]|uniref:7557_t:CDS:1 n=1 Tax=Diversispora eburnea TaxID=1213867 RepID=A0A9N8V7A8_9GLOM|nr:7557_t:CDS:2 [Diversispora eburnea]